MPKKWKGENPKAVEARERKESKKQAELDQKKRAEEDAYWQDDDKHVHRKEQRKVQLYFKHFNIAPLRFIA